MYKRLYYNFIVIDKLAVKVIEAKKGLDAFYCLRGLPVINSFNLFRVDFNSIYTHNKSKILYTFYPKFAFLDVNL